MYPPAVSSRCNYLRYFSCQCDNSNSSLETMLQKLLRTQQTLETAAVSKATANHVKADVHKATAVFPDPVIVAADSAVASDPYSETEALIINK